MNPEILDHKRIPTMHCDGDVFGAGLGELES